MTVLALAAALSQAGCPQGCRPDRRANKWDEKHAEYLAELAAQREARRLAGLEGDAGDLAGNDDEPAPRPETERVETLVIALPDDPISLNPAFDPDVMAQAVALGTIYEPLLRWKTAPDGSGAAAAGVCDSWTIDVTGRRVELGVREGARWHDGRAVTSSDLQFTLDTLRSGDSKAQHLHDLLSDIERVELAGPRRVRIQYTRASAYTLRNLAEVPVLPMHLLTVADVMQPRGRHWVHPVGSGPWRLVRWKRGSELLLTRWDSYPGPRPGYRWLEFVIDSDGARVLTRAKQGDIDVVARVPASYLDEQIKSPAVAAAFERRDLAPARFLYVVLNQRKGRLLEDVRLRRALAALLDRQQVISGGYRGLGVPVSAPVWPGGPVSGPAAAPGPPDAPLARRLLDYADWWKKDKDGFRERQGHRLILRMLAASGPMTKAFTDSLVPAARESGIVLTVARAEPAYIMSQLRAGDFDLALLEYGGMPDQDLGELLGSQGTRNYGGVAEAEVDAALEALRRAEGPERINQAARLARVMGERMPVVTLARPIQVALVRRGVEGLEVEGGWFALGGVRPAGAP